jgi:ERCC4-type nuclease
MKTYVSPSKGEIKHTILCDTREQKRLEFEHPDIICTKKQKLNVGDYCICFADGFIPGVCFERKSIGDLFGSLSADYSRIREEILRAHCQGIKLIFIVEGSLTKVLKGYKHSRVAGTTIMRTLFSLWIRYEVVPVFVKDREEMALYIVEYYLAIWRKRVASKLEKSCVATKQ